MFCCVLVGCRVVRVLLSDVWCCWQSIRKRKSWSVREFVIVSDGLVEVAVLQGGGAGNGGCGARRWRWGEG